MPQLNKIKEYEKNGTYHIYNRGVNFQPIFHEAKDYKRFLKTLSMYTSRDNSVKNDRKNYYNKVFIRAFCLLPTHFHLLLRQVDERTIAEFMKSLNISYSMYLSFKYPMIKRGHLYQDIYKARLIKSQEDYLDVLNYIHKNPIEYGYDPYEYPYSSANSYKNNESQYDFLFLDA